MNRPAPAGTLSGRDPPLLERTIMTLAHKAKALAVVLGAVTVLATTAHAAKPTTQKRAEIPAEFRWDFSAIYRDWPAWEAGMAEVQAKMDAFAKLKGTLAQGPAAVLKAYQGYDEIGKLEYLVYRYPQLQRDVDTRDQAVAGRFQRVGAVFAKFETATSWFTPELLKIPLPAPTVARRVSSRWPRKGSARLR